MICASITETNPKDAAKAANSVDSDAVELRMDYFRDLRGLKALGKIKKPVIIACQPAWEGGKFSGNEKERIGLLLSCLDYCDYVTIELNTEASLRDKLILEAKKKKIKVIVSFHDFEETQSKEGIKKILKKERSVGADIAKVAFTAKSYNDALRTMEILLEKSVGIPVIAISMGSFGKISRVLGPLFGSYLTYASPKKGKESASGQMTVQEIKTIMEALK